MVDLKQYPRPVAGVIGRVVNDEAVIVLPEKGEVKVLNAVGALIWSLADGAHSLAEIAAAIHEQFDVDLAIAEPDMLAFVGELTAKGMLRLEADPLPPKAAGV